MSCMSNAAHAQEICSRDYQNIKNSVHAVPLLYSHSNPNSPQLSKARAKSLCNAFLILVSEHEVQHEIQHSSSPRHVIQHALSGSRGHGHRRCTTRAIAFEALADLGRGIFERLVSVVG